MFKLFASLLSLTMQINEITASFGATIQIKQYEPISFHSSLKATIETGDDPKKAYQELHLIAKESVRDQVIIAKGIKQENQEKKATPVKKTTTSAEALAGAEERSVITRIQEKKIALKNKKK